MKHQLYNDSDWFNDLPNKELYIKFHKMYLTIQEYIKQNFNLDCNISFYTPCCQIKEDYISLNVIIQTKKSEVPLQRGDYTILNSIKINLSVALFLFHQDETSRNRKCGAHKIKNITSLFEILDNNEPILITPKWQDFENLQYCTFIITPCAKSSFFRISDELGELINIYDYVDTIRCVDIPFVGNTYNLVGVNYHAEKTAKNRIECILLAETNNQYDDNAIKILRWFPKLKNCDSKNLSDHFFDLGYISRNENSELHKFMIENDSRVLFGHIENSIITIDGGINMFLNSEISFPKPLLNIEIL